MGKLIILLGILMPFAAVSASVEGITILSQEYHVSGYAAGTILSSSYDQTSPVSGSASAFWWDDGFYSESNPGTNEVSSSAGDFSVTAADRSCWTFTESWAIAESTYIFSPLTEYLQFQYVGSVEMHAFENKVSARVFDITDDLLIDYREWSTEFPSLLAFNEAEYYAFDLSHQYELQLYAKVFAGDNPGATSSLEVSIVPEPCNYVIAGDLDGNCRVNLADLAIMVSTWMVDCYVDPGDAACVPIVE
jgi:hypothetical protein